MSNQNFNTKSNIGDGVYIITDDDNGFPCVVCRKITGKLLKPAGPYYFLNGTTEAVYHRDVFLTREKAERCMKNREGRSGFVLGERVWVIATWKTDLGYDHGVVHGEIGLVYKSENGFAYKLKDVDTAFPESRVFGDYCSAANESQK